ncbi:TonB-dependent receptor [Aurantiacibacter sp. DGU5]|uniref:TonB-dependent receptor n=2 Tax=Aurantiacibacter flavus TaxID=3145232 RepID=A0ABV0CVM9_9SPHN
MNRPIQKAVTLLLATTSVLAAGEVSAQTSDSSVGRAESEDQIVVTAQFREQALQDTPIAITAMSADLLESRGQETVADIGNFTPNVKLSQSSSLVGNSLIAFIRGVGQFDSNFALEPGVGVYVDDVYYGTTFGAVFDLSDLERVEVLRGPQGTLTGKNSLGGAVRLITQKPDGNDNGYVEATYGAYDRMELRAAGSITLAEGLYARVSGLMKRADGYMTLLDYGCANPGSGIAPSPAAGNGCEMGTEGGQDVKALRLNVRYAPAGAPIEINLSADIASDTSESVATKLLFASNPGVRSYDADNLAGGVPFDDRFITGPESYISYADYSSGGNYTTNFGTPLQVLPGTFDAEPRSEANSFGVSANIVYEMSENISLTSITAYREADGYAGIDIDGSPLAILTQAYDLSHKQFTQELRISAAIGDAADLTVGGFYYEADDLLANRTKIPSVLFDFLSNDPVETTSKSLFAHVEVRPAPDLTLIGGLRYTDDRKTYEFSRRNPDGSLPSGIPLTTNFLVAGLDGEVGVFDDDRLDYRIGVNYRWSDALMTYAQVATGFKGGGVNPRPYVADQVVPFGPETLTSYEIGFKSDIGGRVLRLNGAAFLNKFQDIQIALLQCPFSASVICGLPANAGDADVKGLELEAVLQPVAGLRFNGALGYLDFEYTDVDPLTGVTEDMVAPFVNEWQLSAGVEYEAALGSGYLTPRLDWTYQSSFYFNAVNSSDNLVDGYSLFNARLSYESGNGNWTVSAAVTNLFDKFYYIGLNENIAAYGVSTGIVGRPREWSISLRRNF